MGKRLNNVKKGIDLLKEYKIEEAVAILKKSANTKFDETVELHFKLGIDPKQADQMIRGTMSLPHGTGKKIRLAVVCKGEKMLEAKNAGADIVGGQELIDEIALGKMDFDVLVATPDLMKDLAKLGKVLGPKGLMPNPKSGTVTFEVERAVKELKAGRIEYKNDPQGIVHLICGKAAFPENNLAENVKTAVETLTKNKPSSSKGIYMQSVTLSSTMGPGLKIFTEKQI
ncbi:MAG: 50S ribosomal protein L1 [Elusimicrobia bacterium CG08_land_8_20_14_0_20_51_18]|nr:MAG: 50S ribosomal protein L1 [Elusimicrobia bacterium CG08_land_8_20_14_0_20_51_18]